MAHSVQSVGDRTERFNDGDLMALVCLMSEITQRDFAHYRAVSSLVAEWGRDLVGYGPGCIDLRLEDAVASESAGELALLLSQVKQELQGAGPTIPASRLNARVSTPDVKFVDFPTALLLEALEKLAALAFPAASP